MFVDTHCHLNFKAFRHDIPEVIARAEKAGVTRMILPGAKLDSSRRAVDLAQTYPSCFAAVGVHPHHAKNTTVPSTTLQKDLEGLALLPRVVAIGECGLDYHHYREYPSIDQETKQEQRELFLLHCAVAKKHHLPLIIHCRDAYDDMFPLLEEHALKAVVHCFEGTTVQLDRVLQLGCFVGFDGNSTYSDNEHLRQLIKHTPLDRLLLETDAPFLTPVPHRGTRNEPAFLVHLAQTVATLHEKTIQEIADMTTQNAHQLFRL